MYPNLREILSQTEEGWEPRLQPPQTFWEIIRPEEVEPSPNKINSLFLWRKLVLFNSSLRDVIGSWLG